MYLFLHSRGKKNTGSSYTVTDHCDGQSEAITVIGNGASEFTIIGTGHG